MKIIFLDIDGVISTPDCVPITDGKYYALNRECIKVLNEVMEKTGARLVLSSSWKHLGLDPVNDHLIKYGVREKCIDKTPGVPENFHVQRGDEIAKWLINTKEKIESFVILDDDSDMCGLFSRLVQIDRAYGLQSKYVERILELLNTPVIGYP